MKKGKSIFALLLSAVMICTLTLTGCEKKAPAVKPIAKVNSKEAYIGLKNIQKWLFKKEGDTWKFDGVYATRNGKEEKVFYGTSGKLDEEDKLVMSGEYFNVQGAVKEENIGNYLDGKVTDIKLEENDGKKSLLLTGKGFTSILTATKDDHYISREITITVPKNLVIYESEVSFTLRSNQSAFYEYGYVLTHANDEPQTSVPYAFPAITTKLTAQDDNKKQFNFTEVMDYYNTSECFKTARRNENLNGFVELGIISTDAQLMADTEYTLSERISVRDGSEESYYDMIGDARAEYSKNYDVPVEQIAVANGNMGVSDWIDAAYGAIGDILDTRGRPTGDDGIWGPYGYQNSGSEAFGSMDLLKGFVRYAKAIGDEESYQFGLKRLKNIITQDENGNGYIMPLNKYYPNSDYPSDMYFYRACNGNGGYSPEDSWDSTQPRIGSFKYYSRVLNLGELALVTGDEDIEEAFMSLMPLVKKMRGEDFEQAVEWNFDCTPAMDYENGGSGGAAAMWAEIMLTAAEMEQDKTEKEEYIELAKGSIKRSNEQGFSRSSSLREYPKPESIGYAIRANVELYEITNDKYYLDNALEIYNGIYFYYFVNSHPYTYYQTIGYGYACARERWEAFMEMVESIVLVTPILRYTDDTQLLELIYTTQNSALWALPVNGYPDGYLGGHSDWLDALYVPFEQPTGALGDNPTVDGGGMSYLRHSKELYGIGEIFTGALTFETFAKSANNKISIFAYNAATDRKVNQEEQNFKLFNASKEKETTILTFDNFKSGSYTVKVDEKKLGTYTDVQLRNGIPFTLEGRAAKAVYVKRNGDAKDAKVNGETKADITACDSVSTIIQMDGEKASHYIVEVSTNEAFSKDSTTKFITREKETEINHCENSRLYVRVTAIDKDGNANAAKALTVETKNQEIGLIEDFGYTNPTDGTSIGGWKAEAQSYDGKIAILSDCNGFKNYPDSATKQPQGYMAVYKPQYAGEDVDAFTKTFSVDLSQYSTFDFYPYTKNVSSKFSLKVTVGGNEKTLIDKAEGFDRYCYRFDLSELGSGKQDVTVTMVSEGYNRGFAISRMMFVKDTAFDGKSDLTGLKFTSNAETNNKDGLTITNPDDMSKVSNKNYSLGKFNPGDYKELEIVSGLTLKMNARYAIAAKIYKDSSNTPVYTLNKTLVYAKTPTKIPLSSFPGGNATYRMEVSYYSHSGKEVNSIDVEKIRLNGDKVAKKVNVVKNDPKEGVVLDGWKSNWAFANAQGYIVNTNDAQPYGSIYYEDLTIDLDKTPVVRFKVSDVLNNTPYTLKVNDGTLADDILIAPQKDVPGTYTANLRDSLKRGGVIKLRMDFYVLHEASKNGGVKFEGVELLTGKSLYENISNKSFSTTISEKFTVDLSETPYINVNIAELTYDSSWLMYVEENGSQYELKTVYESVYGKMYGRKKIGSFKYDLRDVLPKGSDVRNLKLIIKTDGEKTMLTFRSIRLSANNDVEVSNIPATVRNK